MLANAVFVGVAARTANKSEQKCFKRCGTHKLSSGLSNRRDLLSVYSTMLDNINM